MRAVLPVTNADTMQALIDNPRLLRPDDWVTVNSGGVDRIADPAGVQARAERLAEVFPQNRFYAFTSGLANVRKLAEAIRPPLAGILYDYEPNYPNEPEFSFDLRETFKALTDATTVAHSRGLRLVAYLSGQGLFNPNHQWDYGAFRPYADEIFVQTQSSLRHQRWPAAVERLLHDFGFQLPHVQVTICPGLPNTVDVDTARAAWSDAERRGFPGCVVWWVPHGLDELKRFFDFR
jgi:hypothetical protein